MILKYKRFPELKIFYPTKDKINIQKMNFTKEKIANDKITNDFSLLMTNIQKISFTKVIVFTYDKSTNVKFYK